MRLASHITAVGAALAALPLPAFAQSDASEVAPVDEPAEEAKAAAREGGPGFSRVVDDDETIYAIQRKAYLIENTLELSVLYTSLVGDRFVGTADSLAVSGGAAYHFSEAFAVEVFGGWFNPTESETTTELLAELQLETENAKLTQLIWAAGAGVQWSPIYGKLDLLDGAGLGNFAFYLGVGAAIGQTRVQCKGENQLDPNKFGDQRCQGGDAADVVVYEPNTTRPMAVLTVGFRSRLLTWFAVKAEVRNYMFASSVFRPEQDDLALSDSIRNNLFFQVGASFLLGGESN